MKAVVTRGIPLSSRPYHVVVVNEKGTEVDILGSYGEFDGDIVRDVIEEYNKKNKKCSCKT